MEDHPSLYVVDNDGDRKSPNDRVVGPLPNGQTPWLTNGGSSPNHLLFPIGSKYIYVHLPLFTIKKSTIRVGKHTISYGNLSWVQGIILLTLADPHPIFIDAVAYLPAHARQSSTLGTGRSQGDYDGFPWEMVP